MPQNHHNGGRSASRAVAGGRLVDNFNREINYLRLSITDRCDLRCRYCCPEEGIDLVSHQEILSFEEIVRLSSLFASLGVNKLRLTGGEPFARKGVIELLHRLKRIEGVEKLYLTTNGIQAADHLEALRAAGVNGINLSLDTLDRQRYAQITRRDRLDDALRTLHGALAMGIPIKLNSVMLDDTTDAELRDLAAIARDNKVDVRFIEYMHFSGAKKKDGDDNRSLLLRLKTLFPELRELESSTPGTARLFALPGYRGRIGIIEGHGRHFCASCNKVRLTATGMLKTCLYDDGVLDLRDMLRRECGDQQIRDGIRAAVTRSVRDGFVAEQNSCGAVRPSMASIGG